MNSTPRHPNPVSFIGFYTCSATSPCPMGVSDYGVNKASTYSYKATTFQSWANFTKLSIGASPIGCITTQVDCMSIQQNLVDYNVFEQGSPALVSGVYWAQDVVFVGQSGTQYTINQIDNIWNLSAPYASSPSVGIIYPNLLGNCAQYGGQPQYYYCLGNQQITTTLPFEIRMTTTTGVLSSGPYSGSSYVQFGIWVYHSGKLVSGDVYDEVAFNGHASSSPYFYVSGTGTNPYGILNDAETVLCGPGGGSSVTINSIRASFSESYIASGSITMTRIPHAWSAGTDTAETVLHVLMSKQSIGIGKAAAGVDDNKQLW
ncbi:MAG TPA: thermopsin family protease [Nitrososphaerales archaeon]|nr:thermopsin family protease [Nitrososphaerales archaeon]